MVEKRMRFSHGLDPDVGLVLKHWSLWIKFHIQVSEFKWRTHNNSILWPHLPSVDSWICCAHSFTCTAWCKKKKRDLHSISVGYWAKPVPFLELSHLILSVSDLIWSYLQWFNALRFSYYPGPAGISVLLNAVFSCQFTQRIHDGCGCHRNDSSIIKVAACDHTYSKESWRGWCDIQNLEMDLHGKWTTA